MSALTDYFTSLANKIRSKTGSASTMTPAEMVSEVDTVYSTGQANPVTQTKSCTPSTTAQTITPDSGKFLSSVSVDAIQTQTKTASAIPSSISFTSGATVTPDSGKLLSSVTIPKPFGGNVNNIVTEGTATVYNSGVTKRLQYSFPSSGYFLLITPPGVTNSPLIVSSCEIKKSFQINCTVDGTNQGNARAHIVESDNSNAGIVFSSPSTTSSSGSISGTYLLVKLAER